MRFRLSQGHAGRVSCALPAIAAFGLLAAAAPAASADPIEILFVGNSFTHGRYDPVRNYNSGYDSGPGAATGPHVHDLLCPSAATCSAAESVSANNPDTITYPAGVTTVAQKLAYLNANPSAQYAEAGPYGGVPGIFLQLTQDKGLNYDVSTITVSAATLAGKSFNGSVANSALIGSSTWDHVVLQDQSFEPLPSTITVNGQSVATRGDPASFRSGVNGLVTKIDAADAAVGKADIPVTLYETQPLASYGYTSNNPNAPIYGSSTSPAGGVNAPYVGAANPMQQMAGDLHTAYEGAAAAWNTANPTKSDLDVALAGDAWVSAMNLGIAQTDPFLTTNPASQVDLWDSDPLDACCTAPIGYHPSTYGAYLDALVLFDQITGVNPETLGGNESAAEALGISPVIASELQMAAAETVAAGQPVPEPGSLLLLGAGIAGMAMVRRRPAR